jgi:hypothetical protein
MKFNISQAMLVPTFGGMSQSDKKPAFLRLMARIRAIPVTPAWGRGMQAVSHCDGQVREFLGEKKPADWRVMWEGAGLDFKEGSPSEVPVSNHDIREPVCL